jgi:hypothetical protein
MMTTSLTTIATAPSYDMYAVPVATDWVTLSLGSYYKLSPRAVLRTGVSAMLANPELQNYGADLGINIGF